MEPLFRLVIRSHPSRSSEAQSVADSGKFIIKYQSHLVVLTPKEKTWRSDVYRHRGPLRAQC